MHAFTIILNRQNEFSKQAEKTIKKSLKTPFYIGYEIASFDKMGNN